MNAATSQSEWGTISPSLLGSEIESFTNSRYQLVSIIPNSYKKVVKKTPNKEDVIVRISNMYRCFEVGIPQILYACKVIPKINSPEYLERLKREVDILYSIRDHANVISIFDLGEDDNFVFIFMPLMEEDLFSKISQRKSYKEQDAIRIIQEILRGLAYIHGKGFCHRDLKPENLLCSNTEPFQVVIAGLELSKEIALSGTILGTERYMAPEVLNSTGKYNEKCDIWSLGVIAYILLTGTFPFPVKEKHVQHFVCKKSYDEETLREKEISEEGQAFIAKLLVKNPKKRPSAQELLDSDPWLNLTSDVKSSDVDLTESISSLPDVESGKDMDGYNSSDDYYNRNDMDDDDCDRVEDDCAMD